jgi:Ser/Thr protein kinase RdoA (MazF antagonist)
MTEPRDWTPVAERLLRHYDLPERSLAFLGQSGSTTFKLSGAPEAPPCYAVKLYVHGGGRPEGSGDVGAVRPRLRWLAALDAETPLRVPAPVRSRAGELAVEVPLEDAELPSVVGAVLRWVPGTPPPGGCSWRRPRPMDLSPRQAVALGRMVGELHRHARAWTPAEAVCPARPAYTVKRLFRYLNALQAAVDAGALPREDDHLVRQGALQIAETLRSMGQTTATWGLIHADLNPENLRFAGSEPAPIDFDLCGFGYYLYDLAYLLLWIAPRQLPEVLEGYLEISSVPGTFIPLLETFYLWAMITMLKFWLPLDPEVRRQFELYLMHRRFLLGNLML